MTAGRRNDGNSSRKSTNCDVLYRI